MPNDIDDIYPVGWGFRFKIGPNRKIDVYICVADHYYALRRARSELKLGNDSPFPEQLRLTERDCVRLKLKPGDCKVFES